jgi:lipopolysaccharide biosynthesis glycosyltransferase
MELNIAFGASENWLQYTIVTITSILLNAKNSDEFNFYILCNHFSDKTFDAFDKLYSVGNCEIQYIELKDSYFENAVHDWLGVSALYRLRLPTVVNHLDKILYLDSDIVVEKSLGKLYQTDISDYYLGAVEDKYSELMKKRVNLSDTQTFFNSGVQLLNLKKYRENYIEEKMFATLRNNNDYTDQDVLNDICKDNILSLPLKYNLMPSDGYINRREEYETALKSPTILHYTKKPWSDPNAPYKEHWNKYLRFISNI